MHGLYYLINQLIFMKYWVYHLLIHKIKYIKKKDINLLTQFIYTNNTVYLYQIK